MVSMKKVYRIKITGAFEKPGIWYANKIGDEYDAELNSTTGSKIVTFSVNPCQFVHLIDCQVISERLVEKYYKSE